MHYPERPSGPTSASILLVEDDVVISQILVEAFVEAGFAACAVSSGLEMDLTLQHRQVDLLILDVMLPGEDGFDICRRVRAISSIPIIILTALAEDMDRIVGLEIGADDYLTKPLNTRVLVARIGALLRRVRSPDRHIEERPPRTFRFAGWKVDPIGRRLHSPEGVHVPMTGTEFDLLLAFCRSPGHVLSRKQLLAWTRGSFARPIHRSIDVHVSRIRQKIETDPREPTLIKTVRRGGYAFIAHVEAD